MTRRAGPWTKVPRALWTDERSLGLDADALLVRVTIHAWASPDETREPEGAGWLVCEEGLPWSIDQLAAAIRRPVAATERALAELRRRGLVAVDEVSGALLVPGWVAAVEGSSTSRVRRHRHRERARAVTETQEQRPGDDSSPSFSLISSSSVSPSPSPKRAKRSDLGEEAAGILEDLNAARRAVGLRGALQNAPGTRAHLSAGIAKIRAAAGGSVVEVEVRGVAERLDLDTPAGRRRAWAIVADRKRAEVEARGEEAARYFTAETLARHFADWILERGAWDAPATGGPPSARDGAAPGNLDALIRTGGT